MPDRRTQRLARQVAHTTGGTYRAALPTARTLAAAGRASTGDVDQHRAGTDTVVLTLLPAGNGWRLVVLRGDPGPLGWLAGHDPDLPAAGSAPTLTGVPLRPPGDPVDHLTAVLLLAGAHVAHHTADVPAGVTVRADLPAPSPGLVPATDPLTRPDPDRVADAITTFARLLDRHQTTTGLAVADAVAAADSDDPERWADVEDFLADVVGAAATELAETDPAATRTLAVADWHAAHDHDLPATGVLGLPERYGWSLPDLWGGLGPVPWPPSVTDALGLRPAR